MYSGFADSWRISDLLLFFQQSSKRICKISAADQEYRDCGRPFSPGIRIWNICILHISGMVFANIRDVWIVPCVGLEQGKAYFVSDNFWPMILGQTGWPGLVCFGIVVIFLFLRVQKLYETRKGLYLSGLIVMAYLLIASVAESAFVHPTAIPLAVWLGKVLNEGN